MDGDMPDGLTFEEQRAWLANLVRRKRLELGLHPETGRPLTGSHLEPIPRSTRLESSEAASSTRGGLLQWLRR